MRKKGLLFVISAPSGAGKTTLCTALLRYIPNIFFSVSVTTRQPRAGEVNGKDYFFISKREFKNRIRQNEFIEWAKVHDHLYGTPKKFIEECISKGQDIILDIDIQGGFQIKKIYPLAVLIFIVSPSLAVLEKRLINRGMDYTLEIQKRLQDALQEIKWMKQYDYVVVNNKIAQAIKHIENIISNERSKRTIKK